jgi:hypothetical protein
MPKMILTGDVNLMNVDDATVPFARVQQEFRAADIVFSNLECCLYDPPRGHATENEGFFASSQIGGDALRAAGIGVVGIANNVNYGDAAITASVAARRTRPSTHRRRCQRGRGAHPGHRGTQRHPLWLPATQLGVLADKS